MGKPWTRNQKLILLGIIATLIVGVIGFIVKINIDVQYLQDEVENLKAKNAKIGNLESQVATINTLIANQGNFEKISVGQCPPGQQVTGKVIIAGNEFVQCG